MAIKLGGGGGSASQINEIVTLTNSTDTVTLDDERVYLKGGVFETTVSNYPDATTSPQLAGVSFSVGSQMTTNYGVAWDGTYFHVLDGYNHRLYKYSSSGNYQGSYLTVNQFPSTSGVVWDANPTVWEFKIVASGNRIVRYAPSGTYNGNFFINGQTSSAKDITTDDTNFYVLDSSRNVFKYNASFVYQSTVATGVGHPDFAVKSLTFDGTFFYIMSTAQHVYKYNSSWVLQGSFNVTGDTTPEDIMSKRGGDTSLFVCGRAATTIKEYKPAVGVISDPTLGGQNYVRVK
jgi:hypothetical protein